MAEGAIRRWLGSDMGLSFRVSPVAVASLAVPVLVAATLNLGPAIWTQATLSLLGVGMPITQPSLGVLVRIGNQYFFPASGGWWSSPRCNSASSCFP
jgi:hypothetical protein